MQSLNMKHIPYLLNIVYACLSIILICCYYTPWVDEVGTADVAVNFAKTGIWNSNVWLYTYNPLHAFLLIGWIKIFGVSHLSICAINLGIAFIISLISVKILKSDLNIRDSVSLSIFSTAYWVLCNCSFGGGFGRIDFLLLLFTLLLIRELLLPKGQSKVWKTSLWSFLTMATGVYSIPVVLYLFIIKLIFVKETRLYTLRQLFFSVIGFSLCFIAIILFYSKQGSLSNYLMTFYTFNGTITNSSSLFHRLFCSYWREWIYAFCLFIIVFYSSLLNFSPRNILIGVFITAVPAVMTLAGRYCDYYRWLYELPALFFSVYLLQNNRKILVAFLLIICVFSFHSKRYHIHDGNINEYKSFVCDNEQSLKKTENIVFSDSMFYYLFDSKCRRYCCQFSGDFVSIISNYDDELEKAITYLESKILLSKFSNKLEGMCRSQYRFYSFPDEGLLVNSDEVKGKNAVLMLQRFGYECRLVNAKDRFSIFYFRKY